MRFDVGWQRERRARKRTLVTLVKGTAGERRIGDDATRVFRAAVFLRPETPTAFN